MKVIGLNVMWNTHSEVMSIEINRKLTENVDTATAMALIRQTIEAVEKKAAAAQGN
jgi:hypothetical protein